MEPQVGIAPVRVDRVFVTQVLVSEGGGPERPDVDVLALRNRDTNNLQLGRVGLELMLPSDGCNAPGQDDVAFGE